ncbi:hypothetical protein [Luteolibacter soli]|uniref:Uncharacterized protein n=1 Tax=Luteolibacter soli TaxID=3135280 RepID=A0ABU9AU33_9BACT
MIFPRLFARILLAWLAASSVVRADLTQEQIRTALGSPPELTWALTGVSAASWRTDDRGLFASTSSEYGVETTVNGPGLISLNTKSDGGFRTRVWIDGVMSGGEATDHDQAVRAEVPVGAHVVRWSARRQFSDGRPAAFSNAGWEPFSEVPLDKAKAGTGIALAAGGNKPWRGQNAWHRGDGGAAWSGLRISRSTGATPEPQEPLTATVRGPAVLSYHARFRGYGPSTFRIDGKKNALTLGAEGDWKRNLSWVGPGTHIATWEAGYYLAGSRYDFDLAVDDVELLPLIPYATALDTSEAGWTATANSTSGQEPFGISDPQAVNGSLVILPVATSLTTRLAGPALLSLRTDSGPVIEVDGSEIRPVLIGEASLGAWRTLVWTIGAGDHELRIGNPGIEQGVQIDQLKINSPPETLEQTLGLPKDSLTTGGNARWETIPMPTLNGYVVRAVLDREHPVGWLETTVDGPMEISFTLADTRGSQALKLLVDGVPLIVADDFHASARAVLETPQGTHVIRWLAELPPGYDSDDPLEASFFGVQMLHLDPPGKLLAALDTNLPVVTLPLWHVTRDIPGAEGGASVQPGNTGESTWCQINTGFVGPGYLEFRWHASLDEGGIPEGNWWFDCLTTGLFSTFGDDDSSSDWRTARYWLPPGYHRVQWEFFGTAGDSEQAALDGVHFTPTPTVDLAASLDAEEIPWENDVNAPWIGSRRDDPEDDFAVSPALTGEETSRLATTVTGPGELSFVWKNIGSLHYGSAELRINGITCAELYDPYHAQTVTVRLPDSGASVVEWIVTGEISRDNVNMRVELDQVRWSPYFTSPWAEALDTGRGVKWHSGGDAPFGGSNLPGAMGGTAAIAIVKSGENAWLETTVNGPGLFEFSLLEPAYSNLYGNPWIYWTLAIDGTPVAVDGAASREPFWITGPGKHRVRLTLRIPDWKEGDQEWIAGAVDQVTWQPMKRVGLNKGGGLPRLNWKSSSSVSPVALSRAGRQNEPAIVLNTLDDSGCWVETKVHGPCELSWDSALSENWGTFWHARNSLQIDGAAAIPMTAHAWQRMRLTLPPGPHSIRWNCDPYEEPWEGGEEGEESPVAFDAMWRIGNLSVRRGYSQLSAAVDVPELFALETGDNGGSTVTVAGEDAWQPGYGSSLYFFHPSRAEEVRALWGRPGKMSGTWRYQDQDGYGANLTSNGGSWESHVSAMAPGRFSRWTYLSKLGRETPLLASLSIDSSVAKAVAEAAEFPTPVTANGWVGRDDGGSPVGGDSAWSFLSRTGYNSDQVAETTVVGPARLSFWWKRRGSSILSVSLDGGLLPIPSAGEAWTRVELAVNAGSHVVRWSHEPGPGTSYSDPSEAWLDGLLLTNAAARSLDQAASLDPAVLLSTNDDLPLSWHPVAHAEADGSWTEAVRAISGSRVLKTTVNGPSILSFRARAFTGLPIAGLAEVSISMSGGGSGPPHGGGGVIPTVLGFFLAAQVDGTTVERLDATTTGEWEEMSVQVPAGSHEVSFQLMASLESWLFDEYEAEATQPDLQGWLDDFRLERIASPLSASSPQTASHQSPGNDADHDGASDDLEYWFGTDPENPSSVPPALEIHTAPGQPLAPATWLMIPYLPFHASGAVLEASSDLLEWQPLDVPLLHEPPSPISSLPWAQATATHYPWVIPPGGSQQYFRLRFPDLTD